MRRLTVLLSVALVSCQWVNPDAGRFSCAAEADCGAGYTCRPQFKGGGLCFRAGECVDSETCDGADENCDGRIDETFPEAGEACPTGVPGRCAVGARTCVAGSFACQQTVMPTDEACNGVDDDCDGEADESFDFLSDESNCGACGSTCDAGTSCLLASCQETTCDDGLDNDDDGRLDCADEACVGQVCLGTIAPAWRCGVLAADAGVDGGVDAGTTDAGTTDGGTTDAGTTDAGTVPPGCYAPETDCANGLDDDLDGEADCLDVDCAGLTCASGTTCTNRSCPGPG